MTQIWPTRKFWLVVVQEWAHELSRFDMSQPRVTFAGILGKVKLPFGPSC